jgi:hypothetical protein
VAACALVILAVVVTMKPDWEEINGCDMSYYHMPHAEQEVIVSPQSAAVVDDAIPARVLPYPKYYKMYKYLDTMHDAVSRSRRNRRNLIRDVSCRNRPTRSPFSSFTVRIMPKLSVR